MEKNNTKFKKNYFLNFLLILGILLSFITLVNAKAEVKTIEIIDKVDNDGDGYISDFTIKVKAETHINEKGKYIENGGIFTKFGEPWIGVYFPPKWPNFRTDSADLAQGKNSDSNSDTFMINFDYEKVKQKGQNSGHENAYNSYLTGEKTLNHLKYQYLESDSTWEDKDLSKDETITLYEHFILDEPIKLESPSKDKKEQITISSSPSNSNVSINGEYKGKTPLTLSLPVDIYEKKGALNINIKKEGYESYLGKKVIQPPQNLNFELKKVKKPLVVDSNVDSAIVRVNGENIGETPISKNYWVEKNLDLTIQKKGYEDKKINSVNTPENLNIKFNTSNDNSSSSLIYNPDLMNQLNYSLINKINLENMYNVEFNTSSKKVKTNETIIFDASPAYYLTSNITSYSWDFGNGKSANGKQVSYSYSNPGEYHVNLSIENSAGNINSKMIQIKVENRFPKPWISLSSKKIVKGSPISFNGSLSNDPEGSKLSYKWNMGDGTIYQKSSINHVYKQTGEFNVTLNVTDVHGASTISSQEVMVEKPNLKPKAQFSISNKNVKVGDEVIFDASSSLDSDGTISTYAWNLGDGMSKSGSKIKYNYSQAGNYSVELNVLDNSNLKSTITKNIVVEKNTNSMTNNSQKNNTVSNNKNNTEDNTSNNQKGLIDKILAFFNSIF